MSENISKIEFEAGYIITTDGGGRRTRYPITDFLSGSISTAMIEDGAITTAKIALDTILAVDIAAGAVGESELATGAVTVSKIGTGAVNYAKIADGNVEAVHIANDNVTTPKLAPGAVTTAKLAWAAVSTDKIADSAVNYAKIAAGNIDASHIANDNILTAALANGAVTTPKLAWEAVTTEKIAAGAVTGAKLAASAVDTAAIANDNVTNAKLGADAVTGAKIQDDAVGAEHIETLDADLVFSSARAVGMTRDNAQVFYVDIGRTASLETGSADSPYKTIMGAVNAVIALQDNTNDKAYVIYVAPGTYTETITLESAYLVNLAFIAMGGSACQGYSAGSGSVILDPSSDPALESEATNTNLVYLYFKGFRFLGSIHLAGDIQNTLFGEKGLTFEDCSFEGFRNGAIHINLTNLERFSWVNGNIGRGTVLTAQNIWSMSINGERFSDWPMDMSGGWTLTATTAQYMPWHMDEEKGGGDQMSFTINNAFMQMSSWTLAQGGDAKLFIKVRNGFLNGSITLPAKASLYGYSGIFNNDVTMNGATNTAWLFNTVIKGTFTRNGCTANIYNNVES